MVYTNCYIDFWTSLSHATQYIHNYDLYYPISWSPASSFSASTICLKYTVIKTQVKEGGILNRTLRD